MEIKVDDTSFETLFWSLLSAIENIDEATEVWEAFEIAGLQLEEDEEE